MSEAARARFLAGGHTLDEELDGFVDLYEAVGSAAPQVDGRR
jgi:hypothetical protein